MSNLTWELVRNEMKNCQQMPGMSVLEHGESILKYYEQLSEMLSRGSDIRFKFTENLNWRLPKWFLEYEKDIAWERHSDSIFYWYLKFHDCGKSYCKIIDDDQKVHFPNHAEKSYEIWTDLNKVDPVHYLKEFEIEIIGCLILHDMDVHIMKAADVDEFCEKLGSMTAISLLLAALAEVHSNAAMFGGTETDSFKAKLKQIERRGNAICKKIFDRNKVE